MPWIRQIEAIGDVNLDSRGREIIAAREAFKALTESQQALVPERVRRTSGECRKEDHRAFGEERQDRCIFKLR